MNELLRKDEKKHPAVYKKAPQKELGLKDTVSIIILITSINT